MTISGHGNPSTLVLGEGRLRSAELDRKSDTDTKKLLEELKPVLIHDGHLTTFLEVLLSRWWFQIFFLFIPTWGKDPIWLIFFKWVETTNQLFFWLIWVFWWLDLSRGETIWLTFWPKSLYRWFIVSDGWPIGSRTDQWSILQFGGVHGFFLILFDLLWHVLG